MARGGERVRGGRRRRVVQGAAGLVLVLSVVLVAGGPVAAQAFASCEEAFAAGYSNLRTGEPGYSLALDRDGDGIACERPLDSPPPEVLAATEAPQAPQAPTTAAAPADDRLADTGTTTWLLLAAAIVLIVAGRRLVSSGYEHLAWVNGRPRSEVRYTVESVRRPRRTSRR